jgi:hypothetical protein
MKTHLRRSAMQLSRFSIYFKKIDDKAIDDTGTPNLSSVDDTGTPNLFLILIVS